jgi:hypothetical protein
MGSLDQMVPERFRADEKQFLQQEQKAATAGGYAMVDNPENVVPPEQFEALFRSDPWLAGEFQRIASDPFYKRQGMPLTSLPVIDAVKKKLDFGRNKALEGRDLYDAGMFKSRLDDIKAITDAAFPDYAATRETWKEFAGISDAADLGRQFMSGKLSVKNDQMRLAIDSMNDADLYAFRVGSAEGLRDRIGGVNVRSDLTKKIVGVPEIEERARLAFGSLDGLQEFGKKLKSEEQLFKTYAELKGGSQTAARQEAGAALSEDPGSALQAFGTAVASPSPTNLAQAGIRALQKFSGPQVPESTRNQIADILLGRDTQQLSRQYQNTLGSAETRRKLARMLATAGTTQVGGSQ